MGSAIQLVLGIFLRDVNLLFEIRHSGNIYTTELANTTNQALHSCSHAHPTHKAGRQALAGSPFTANQGACSLSFIPLREIGRSHECWLGTINQMMNKSREGVKPKESTWWGGGCFLKEKSGQPLRGRGSLSVRTRNENSRKDLSSTLQGPLGTRSVCPSEERSPNKAVLIRILCLPRGSMVSQFVWGSPGT